jgi:hypothetical protein
MPVLSLTLAAIASETPLEAATAARTVNVRRRRDRWFGVDMESSLSAEINAPFGAELS